MRAPPPTACAALWPFALLLGCKPEPRGDGAPPVQAAGGAVSSSRSTAGGAPLCVLHLHGKSGRGAETSVERSITHVRPDGNAEGWGGLQWLYFPGSGYRQVRDIVARAIANAACSRVIVHGFSNGASAAAKLFCRGERFGGSVIGYIVDDPVTDRAVEGCRPAPGVKIRVYWTGALSQAVDGWRCASSDWTCEGGVTIGIDRYARLLGTTATPSIHREHQVNGAPPEYRTW